KRTGEQNKLISDHFLARFPETQKLLQQLDAERKQLSAVQNGVLITMVMGERKQPRESFVLIRGAYDKYGEKVEPAVPKALPPLPEGAPRNRLGLARWLVAKNNPLTARVIVNRTWQQFFGTGLVKTAEDFGVQGEPPSHPELLDWLATEFMTDWDVKRLHKLIVTSATYRQGAKVTAAALERDPDPPRWPRVRWRGGGGFEGGARAGGGGGLGGGRSVGPRLKPYQPPGLWEDFSFNQIRYVQDHGEALYRRSLYTFWRRSIGPPNMF